jgi:CubicO group peptidase (beta-lactamase class C family)
MMRRVAVACLLLVIVGLADPSLPAHQAPPAAAVPATTTAVAAPGRAAAVRGRTLGPTAAPGSVFDAGRLGRIDTVVQQYVDGQRIAGAVTMRDTHFFLPRDKASRLATVHAAGPDGRIVRAPEAGGTGQGEYVDGSRVCFSGGAGLLSTVHDYARFLQMLLDGGALGGARVLSPASVALMTSNHVGTRYEGGNLGFGLGFEVVEHVGRAGRLAAPGEYGWGGAYYTKYWVDPADGIVGLLFAQLIPAGGLELQNTFRTLVYQAIVRPPAHTSTGARR